MCGRSERGGRREEGGGCREEGGGKGREGGKDREATFLGGFASFESNDQSTRGSEAVMASFERAEWGWREALR